MKTIITILAILLAGNAITFAQCGKKTILSTSKTEHLDANGGLKKTDDEKALVEIAPLNITITVNNEHKMSGLIKSQTCDWKIPFKEGKTLIKATLADEGGDEKNVTITIEGKDGKVTLLFELDEMPDDRIRVVADKFEEAA